MRIAFTNNFALLRYIFPFLFVLVSLAACGGDGDDDNDPFNYVGTWDIRYNFERDECDIVASEVPGFVDQHLIEQEEGRITLAAASELLVADSVTVDENNKLVAEDTVVGDIFDAGFTCTLVSHVSYSNPHDDTADTLFTFRIDCGEIFSCESLAAGEAIRQPV